MRFKYAVLTIFSYVAAFIVLAYILKNPDALKYDIYVALATFASALIGYVIMANMRHETNGSIGRLKYLSMTDALTGLYNKLTFESLCKAFIKEHSDTRNYALLFIDIDKFKQINDSFSHQVGDQVLQNVGRVIKESFYDKDYFCRFGGDEFVVFMADVSNKRDIDERISVFKQKVSALSQVLKTDELSCSVGFALKNDPAETYTELLSRADAELYVAKNLGKHHASFAEHYFKQTAFKENVTRQSSDDVLDSLKNADALGTQRTVLVVDDNELNRQVLHKILETEYSVLEAENGEAALNLLLTTDESICAVLLDILMPVMDGFEVLKKMSNDVKLSQIPVIVTTGSNNNETEERALSLGANDFIAKPYRPSIIMLRLKNTVNLRETAAMVNSVERDSLTGVYTKEFFYKKVNTLLHSDLAVHYDIICSDIEHFKVVNELFGETTGDKLLQFVAMLLKNEVLGKGIVGRVGSDRFACLLPHKELYTDAQFENISQRMNEFLIDRYPPLPRNIRYRRCVCARKHHVRPRSYRMQFDKRQIRNQFCVLRRYVQAKDAFRAVYT